MNSGLGQFCFHLGQAINKQNDAFDLTYYLSESPETIFGNTPHYLRASPWHRFLGVPFRADLFIGYVERFALLHPKQSNTRLF